MSNYLRAISYYRQDLPQIIGLLALISFSRLMVCLEPFPLAILIDSVLSDGQNHRWMYRAFSAVAPASQMGQIILLTGITLAIGFLNEGLRTVQTFMSIRIGMGGLMRVRCDLFRKLQALSIGYHKSQPQGDAIYRLSYDTFGFQTVLGVAVGVLENGITLLYFAAILFSINWKLTLIALAVVPPLIVTIRRYSKVLKQRSTEAHEVDSQLTTTIQRSVSAISLVQAFGREAEEYARFTANVDSSIKAWLKLHWQEVMYWFVIGIVLTTGAAALFGYGGYLVHEHVLPVGLLGVFLYSLRTLYSPLQALSGSGATLQGGAAGVQRVLEVLDRDPVICDAANAIGLPRQPRVLELDHVSFEYRTGEPIIQELSVTIQPGQMVAFVGSSGVGKTTLLNLLPRFYDPTAGALKLDGIDLRHVKVADLRKHIALVLQDSILLPTSIAENIAYGRSDATPAQILRAAEMAGAAVFVEKLPKKFDTEVAEGGQNLSGGQRQRISIARALLTEAPIMVLDEPTSALDPQHEQMITQTLSRLKGLRTMILVSHRLSTVVECDQIFVMEGGRIVEQGTHNQLLATRGLYFAMARHQLQIPDSAPASVA